MRSSAFLFIALGVVLATSTSGQQPAAASTRAVVERQQAPDIHACGLPSGSTASTIVRLTVTADGDPTDESIASTAGNDCLDHAALTAVGSYHFRPATKAGQAISSSIKIRVDFSRY